MRRSLRILLNTATLVSFAALAATTILYVRSYRIADEFTIAWPTESDRRIERHTVAQLLTSRGRARVSIDHLELAGPERIAYRPARRSHHPLRPQQLNPFNNHPWTRIGFDRYWVRTFEAFGVRGSATSYRTPATATVGRTRDVLMTPLWPLAIIAGICPAARLTLAGRRWRNRRRAWYGLCAACAYNLTGNTSGVCPECGAAAPPPTPV